MRLVVIALVCLTVAGLVSARWSSLNEWREYKKLHHKVYDTPEEDAHRFSLYLTSKDRIQQHNAKNSSYKLGLNHLSDRTPEELSKLKGFRPDLKQTEQAEIEAMDFLNQLVNGSDPAPSAIDWREHPGRVTDVKDQGQCGSCWAFSAAGVLEGQEVIRNPGKKVRSLSAQQFVDCALSNYGCSGGWPHKALEDIHNLGGIESLEDYPYVGDLSWCRFVKIKTVMSDDGAYLFQKKGEETLKNLVAKFGPISVAIDSFNWEDYKSGVFDDKSCINNLDHAVLVVGYDTDPKHGDYWIVKNSWNTSWGENGYIRVKRGIGRCGFGTYSTIPKYNN